MDRTSLKILNNELTFIRDIEDYISFYFVKSFFQSKEFHLVAPIKYSSILKKDNYIYLNKNKAMIIEEVEENEAKKQITVKGRDIKSILERRIIIPPNGEAYDKFKGDVESVIKHYIDVCCVNPVDVNRKIPNLIIAPNKNRGSILSWESRYKNLMNETESMSKTGEIGWFIYLDPKTKKLIFDVEVGINRAATQSINSRVIFSSEFNNIANAIHTSNSVNYKNIAYVGGQGEGVEREIKEIKKSEAIGLDRREVFIDARDISDDGNLEDRGLAKLSQFDNVINTESTIINKNLLYERDWNLGDIVTVKSKETNEDLRITEVREIYEGNLTIEIAVGTIGSTVVEQINNSVSSIPNEAGTVPKAWYPSVDDSGNISWEIKSSIESPLLKNIKGPKGDIGGIGPQGIQGIKGEQGVQGIQGPKGDIGAQGFKGNTGDTGATFKPSIDASGNLSWSNDKSLVNPTVVNIKGPKGDKGEQGLKGDKGDQGIQGIKGDTGLQGIQGAQGIQGVQGPAGNGQSYVVFHEHFVATEGQKVFTWNDGYVYPIGINAIKVYLNGIRLSNRIFNETSRNSISFKTALSSDDKVFIEAMQAVVDLQGPKGDTGATGAQGLKGDKGDTGSQGLIGATGQTGANGFTWRPSIDLNGNLSWVNNGSITIPTTVNVRGPQGIQGIQGTKGDTGPIGLQGLKGDTGATGAQGPQGIKGDTGATGTQGLPGKDGTQIITSTARPSGQISGRIWIQLM